MPAESQLSNENDSVAKTRPWMMSASRTAAPPPAASEPLNSTVDAAAAPGPSVDDKIDALQHAVRELRELLLQDVRLNEKQGKKKINVFEGAPDVGPRL